MFLVKLVVTQITNWLTAPNPHDERKDHHVSVLLIVHIICMRR